MKHHVYTFMLLTSFSLCASAEKNVIADKSMRMGRFSYEDSFDESLVEKILNNSSAVVKKNVMKLLYPPKDQEDAAKRLLLLGGVNNAATTAIAKAIALRCGYEYYVIDAATLLREHREGRQMLLSEVRPIIKQGNPIALIITELPEMADYSGVLASTLWILLDQCRSYPDVMVIATSAYHKGQLSYTAKEYFGEGIISVSLDKFMRDQIQKKNAKRTHWLSDKKMTYALVLATVYACAQIVSAVMQMQKEDEKIALMQKMFTVQENMNSAMQALVKQSEEQSKILNVIALWQVVLGKKAQSSWV